MESVVLKTNTNYNKTSKEIQEALKTAIRCNDKIPVIYQYKHTNEQLIVDNDNKIGEVVKVYTNSRGDIVGDIELYLVKADTMNYMGVVDNIAVSNHSTHKKPLYKIDALIIYNKEYKKFHKEKKSRRKSLFNDIPLMSQIDPLTLKNMSDELMGEYEKLVTSQQNDKSK